MLRTALAPIAIVVFGASAAAAPPAVTAVHTDIGEARACLPLAAGGALVGTGGGLVRIDAAGAVTAVWTATDGLPGTRIEAIVELGDAIWIGTDAGVATIALGTGRGFTVSRAVAGRPVRDVAVIGTSIYLATWDGGVRELGARSSTAIKFRAGKAAATTRAARLRVSSLAVIGTTLYAGTAAGLYRLAGGQLEPVAIDGLARGVGVAALHADGDRLWIATTDGLFARDGEGAVRSYGGGDLRDIATVAGAIVVAGVADGLDTIDRGRLVGLDGAPGELAVAQTLGTRGDAVCAGGLSGAWLRTGAAWIRAADRDGPPANDISALAADGDRLWVGTFDHGVAVHDSAGWRTISDDQIDRRVNAILVERRRAKASRIWIATASGLSSIEGDDITRLARRDGLPGRGVLALALLADGRLLVGTSYGAVTVGDDGRPVRLGPKGTELGTVWAVAQDAGGALWLGTTTGLYRGGESDAEWKRFSVATGELADDWVTALVPRGDAIVAGTYKGGVVRFDPATGGAVTATRLGDGWVNPNGLAVDDDALLVSTMDGLAIHDGTTWTTVARMPGKDVTATARIGATLYVSTRRGLAELR